MCEITEQFFQEGRQKGRQEGIFEGRQEMLTESIKNIMESMDCSIEHAMKILKIPEDEHLKYIERIGKKEIV